MLALCSGAVAILLSAVLSVTALPAPQNAEGSERDDVVVILTGDRITGEIKRLERGQLYFDTDYVVDPLRLDWAQVESLETISAFRVLLENGDRYEGVIRRDAGNFEILDSTGQSVVVDALAVVEIGPQEPTFWQQLNGSVNYGFSFTQDQKETQSTLSLSVSHATPGYLTQLSASSIFGKQDNAEDTSRHDLEVSFRKFFSRNWYAIALAGFRSSSQQDLDLRVTLGGGAGRDLIRNNRQVLSASAGVVSNRERYSPSSGTAEQTKAEGALGVSFAAFTFDSSQLGASATYYPEISGSGRYRFDVNANFTLDLIGDFTWNLNFFDNYDSNPPQGTRSNDLGLTTSFGYTF